MQAQTLHEVCPVSVGEFFSPLPGELDGLVTVGSPALEDEVEVALDATVLELLRPGDCPGGMNGDCGELER